MTGSIYLGLRVFSYEESGLVLFGVWMAGRLKRKGELRLLSDFLLHCSQNTVFANF